MKNNDLTNSLENTYEVGEEEYLEAEQREYDKRRAEIMASMDEPSRQELKIIEEVSKKLSDNKIPFYLQAGRWRFQRGHYSESKEENQKQHNQFIWRLMASTLSFLCLTFRGKVEFVMIDAKTKAPAHVFTHDKNFPVKKKDD